MTIRALASLGAAACLVLAPVSARSTPQPRADAPAAHVHGDAQSAAGGGDPMAEHMREMEDALGQARATLERSRGVTDAAKLRAALDEVGTQLDAMQASMGRCKSMMHGK